MDNKTLVREWQNWMKAGGVSRNTIKLYTCYIERFGAEKEYLTAQTEDITQWMNRHDWMPYTRAAARNSLKSLYSFMFEYDYRTDNPMLKTRPVKIPPSVPRSASEEDLLYALERASSRDRLAVLLAAYGGLRRAEIAGLHTSQVFDDHIIIKGKGGRVRMVPLHPILKKELGDNSVNNDYYFKDHRTHEVLSPEAMGKRLSRLLPPGISAHKLRHRFATRIYQNTHDIRSLQTVLGHSSIATTERYVSVDNDALSKIVLTLE